MLKARISKMPVELIGIRGINDIPVSTINGNVIKVNSLNNHQPEVKLFARRYFYLLVVSFGSLLSDITYSEYSIISDVLITYYDSSYLTIQWTSMAYIAGYVVPLYPTILLFEKKGLKVAFVTGLAIVALGLWIQGIGTHTGQFWLILFGQCIISLSQCCFVNLTPQFASYWFDTSDVSTACAVGIFFNLTGMALSCILSPMLVNRFPHLSIGIKLSYLNYAIAAVTTVLAIFSYFVFEERPPNPPSEAQAQIWNAPKGDKSITGRLWQESKELYRNKNFLVHLVTASMMLSFVTFCIIILNQLLIIKYPNASSDIGAIGLVMYFSGIPGTLVIGFIIDRTHKYKEVIVANNIGMFLSLCFFVGSIYVNITTIYVASGVFGFFMVGYINVGLEMASEITYPVGEVVTSSLILLFGSVLGITMTYISNWLLEDYNYIVSLIVLMVYCFVGMFISCFVKSDLRRISASQKNLVVL